MSALRLARGFTGRNRIVKFDGCYHGHADGLLVAAGSGVATLGIPGSPGVPEGTVADTIVLPFNDEDAVRAVFRLHPDDVAAIIVEPVSAGTWGAWRHGRATFGPCGASRRSGVRSWFPMR